MDLSLLSKYSIYLQSTHFLIRKLSRKSSDSRSSETKTKRRRTTLQGAWADDVDDDAYDTRMRKLEEDGILPDGTSDADEDVEKSTADGESTQLSGGLMVPNSIYDYLYEYQRTGVKWMWELHTQHAGGVIGDEMVNLSLECELNLSGSRKDCTSDLISSESME